MSLGERRWKRVLSAVSASQGERREEKESTYLTDERPSEPFKRPVSASWRSVQIFVSGENQGEKKKEKKGPQSRRDVRDERWEEKRWTTGERQSQHQKQSTRHGVIKYSTGLSLRTSPWLSSNTSRVDQWRRCRFFTRRLFVLLGLRQLAGYFYQSSGCIGFICISIDVNLN